MNALRALKDIIQNQKTVSTERLQSLVSQIGKDLKDYSLRVHSQKNTIQELNKKYQQERDKAKSRERAMSDFEHLKRKHGHLKQKHTELEEAYKQLKEGKSWEREELGRKKR